MDVNFLLDKAKKTRSLNTDAELAKALGVSKQAISGWRNGARLPDAVTCAALAGLTGEPLAKVLGIVGEARAVSSKEKSVWRRLAATAAALLLTIGILPSQQAQARVSADYNIHPHANSVCIMRNFGILASVPGGQPRYV